MSPETATRGDDVARRRRGALVHVLTGMYGHELDYVTDPYALCPYAAASAVSTCSVAGQGRRSPAQRRWCGCWQQPIECLKWMHRQCDGPDAPEKFSDPVLLNAVAEVDNLEMAQWLVDRGSPTSNMR